MLLRSLRTLVGLFPALFLAPACTGDASLEEGMQGAGASAHGGAGGSRTGTLPGVGLSPSDAASGSPTPVALKLDGSLLSGSGGDTGTTAPLPTGDANCGTVKSGTSRLPADMLIVLDRSSSMNSSTDGDSTLCLLRGSGCTSRWSAVTSAVKTTVASTADNIHWGLKLFSSPGGSGCAVKAGVEVPIATATSVATIEAQIAATSPGSNTPTAQAITAATAYLKTVQDQNSKYILLATDGEPNCATGGTNVSPNLEGTRNAIAAALTAGFPVYVIGIGPSVTNLDDFASAGGTGKSFSATSPQALADAFSTISKAVATCVFTATKTPPDPNNVAVYVDNNLVPQDLANGWSYGSGQTIVLSGSSCAKVTDGSASSVQVLFGCPGVPPPPIL